MWNLTKNPISGVAVALFVILGGAGFGLAMLLGQRGWLYAGWMLGIYFLFSIKVADQWEKVAVLRLGRYIGLRGPGVFHVIPIVDRLSRFVDQRVRVANVTAARDVGRRNHRPHLLLARRAFGDVGTEINHSSAPFVSGSIHTRTAPTPKKSASTAIADPNP